MNHFWLLHFRALQLALKRLWLRPFSNALILCMLAAALSLPLALYLLVEGMADLTGRLNETTEITLYLDIDANQSDITLIDNMLKKDTRIQAYEFIDKTKALAEVKSSLGDAAEVISILDHNPLPNAFIITPQQIDPPAVEALQQDLTRWPAVDSAQIDARWLYTLYAARQFMYQVLWFLALCLSLAFILVTYNTIRLQSFAGKDEIEVTRLLGAPTSFIRRPFIYLALIQALLALALSLIVCGLLVHHALPQLTLFLRDYGLTFHWRFFNAKELLIITLTVILPAVVGAYLAVNQHLHELKYHEE